LHILPSSCGIYQALSTGYDLFRKPEIGSLRWLVNSPKIEATVLDVRDYPFRVVIPDPRSFAIHKLWLSGRPERRSDKAERDRQQALLVAKLVQERLPQFHFARDDEDVPIEVTDTGISRLTRE